MRNRLQIAIVRAELLEAYQAGRLSSGIMIEAFSSRIAQVRPSVPFDLEPSFFSYLQHH